MRKKWIILSVLIFQLSACEKSTSLEEEETSLQTKNQVFDNQQNLKQLRVNSEIANLENAMSKDPIFINYLKIFDNVRKEGFNYSGEKIDKKMIDQNKKSVKNTDELFDLYSKAGMKNAKKRLTNRFALMFFNKKICEKYPQFAKLSTNDKTTLIIEHSEFKVNKETLKNYVKDKKMK